MVEPSSVVEDVDANASRNSRLAMINRPAMINEPRNRRKEHGWAALVTSHYTGPGVVIAKGGNLAPFVGVTQTQCHHGVRSMCLDTFGF